MHSRIIQLETAPVPEEERTESYEYDGEHWFLHSVADYVINDEDRDGTLEWLKQELAPAAEHIDYFTDERGGGLIFHSGFRQAYFSSEYTAFAEALDKLSLAASPTAFADGSMQVLMYNLKSAYDDAYGFYIQNEETSLVTLNSFLRQAKLETRYYFGGTLDYHF